MKRQFRPDSRNATHRKTFEEAGIVDELDAYNPLIPDGSNLKCTQMIEFPDEDERKVRLSELVDIENRTYVQIQGYDRSMQSR